MTLFAAGLIMFFGPHAFTMFRGARARVIERLGALPYRGLYSLISLAGFILIVIGYNDVPRVQIWNPPVWTRHVSMLLMLPVFVLLTAAYVPGYIKAKVKNPMLLALKTWAFAHLLSNGDLASMLLFGAFLAYGVVDLVAVKRTGRSAVVAAPRASFDLIAVGVGLGIYALFIVWLHGAITGISLLPS